MQWRERDKKVLLSIGDSRYEFFLIQPIINNNIWKILSKAYVNDENLVSRGLTLASKCVICDFNIDIMNHLMWNCEYNFIIKDNIFVFYHCFFLSLMYLNIFMGSRFFP